MTEKKYFWFKMEDDFFSKKEIKKLRTIAGGDTFVIIYLKIILLSLKNGGKLYFEGIDDNFVSEIALEIDEEKDNVGITLEYLLKHASIIQIDDNEFQVNTISNLIGSETSTAIRVRNHRNKQKALQCNTDETPMKQNDNGELEIELEIELEKHKEIAIKKKIADKSALTEDEKILRERLIKDFSAYFLELNKSEISFDGKEYTHLKLLYHNKGKQYNYNYSEFDQRLRRLRTLIPTDPIHLSMTPSCLNHMWNRLPKQ